MLDEVLLYQYFKAFSICHPVYFIQFTDLSDRCLIVDLIKVWIVMFYLRWNLALAQALWERRYAPSVRDAFSRYIGQGGSAYVSRSLLPTEDAIRVIREAGGLPVWAHPLSSLTDPKDFEPLLDRLKEMGLWGVECWFQGADSAQTWRCLNESGKRGLYTTAGTDFHGRPGHPAKISGCLVRDDLLPWARFCGGL